MSDTVSDIWKRCVLLRSLPYSVEQGRSTARHPPCQISASWLTFADRGSRQRQGAPRRPADGLATFVEGGSTNVKMGQTFAWPLSIKSNVVIVVGEEMFLAKTVTGSTEAVRASTST